MNIIIKNQPSLLQIFSAIALLFLSLPQEANAQGRPQTNHAYTGHHQPQANPYMSPRPVAPQPIVNRQMSPAPPQAQLAINAPVQQRSTDLITQIRRRAESISKTGLKYIFGATSPRQGGMDCSGTMMHLLSDLGFYNIPRTSYHQFAWLEANRTIVRSKSIPSKMGEKGLKPGCLIFWGGTYDSAHEVTHVMLYLGQGRDGRHYMFGAKGSTSYGLNGSGVDIFELPAGYNEKLVGYGNLPGTV